MTKLTKSQDKFFFFILSYSFFISNRSFNLIFQNAREYDVHHYNLAKHRANADY